MDQAAEDIRQAGERMLFRGGDLDHRRGDFPAVGIGISFGGGQTVRFRSISAINIIHIFLLITGAWQFEDERHEPAYNVLPAGERWISTNLWIHQL